MVARQKIDLESKARVITTRISQGGQITLPAAARRALGVNLGDTVYVRLEKTGEVSIIKPKYTVADLKGRVAVPTQTRDFEPMIREAQEDLIDSHRVGR